MIRGFTVNSSVQCSTFENDKGAQEFYITVSAGTAESFTEALAELHEAYAAAIEQCGLSGETVISARFHLSNIGGQSDELKNSPIYQALNSGAVSIIEQPPLDSRFVTLFTYHIVNPRASIGKRELIVDNQQWRSGVAVNGENYTMLWLMNLDGRNLSGPQNQSREVFGVLTEVLGQEGMDLLDNTIRTWVFVRDIDHNYSGMVDTRRELFMQQGLTKETRYIASTGIEGRSREEKIIVSMDSLSIANLKPGQIIRMEALDHLSPTIQYGVTFERGSRIRFGDRSHLYISGTASIDRDGKIMHVGDVQKQTARTLENISALLRPQGATLSDMAYIVLYLRNPEEYEQVKEIVEQEVPTNVPRIFLEGAVCRPDWLVEIEGVAIIPDSADFPIFF